MVLIVEDNEKNRKLARDVLELRGFATIEAAGGRDGIEMATSRLPAVILLDIQLPDMTGEDVLVALRDDPRTAPIPVIAVTAYAMKHDRDRFLNAGFDGYISKPINVRTFGDEVGRLCGGSVAGR